MQIGNSNYELNNIYNEDCLQAMKQIPDKYFELCIVDPPYGIGVDGGIGGGVLAKKSNFIKKIGICNRQAKNILMNYLE